MSSQSLIHAYMERHHIHALFEDLMNKILKDMPEEPLVYLLRAIYKKAGIEIPQGIRNGGLRKSTSELRKGISPERRSRSAVVSTSADLGASRPRRTSPGNQTKLKDGTKNVKQKPEWNSDIKIKSSFDELWEETATGKIEMAPKLSTAQRAGLKHLSTSASAWATLGLGEVGEMYTSPDHRSWSKEQTSAKISEKELLAQESMPRSMKSTSTDANLSSVGPVNSTRQQRKMESLKHKQELGQLLSETNSKLTDSGIGLGLLTDDNDDDDAIELLENGDDLRREGVKNIPTSGFKLSKNVRYRENEPCMKLSINPVVYPSEMAGKNGSSETERFTSDLDEEEEFESVSQVTGPRQPVWKLPDFDVITGDAIPLKPTFASTKPYKSNVVLKSNTDRLTSVADNDDQNLSRKGDLDIGAKTWSAGDKNSTVEPVRSTVKSSRSNLSGSSGTGWRLPDDTDIASAYDWNQRVKGGPPRDPRAY